MTESWYSGLCAAKISHEGNDTTRGPKALGQQLLLRGQRDRDLTAGGP